MSARTAAVEKRTSRRLINRELSDLAFVRRVLEEAGNRDAPVLERLNFLGITGLLLDEFYRTRVTGLREQIRAGVRKRSADGLDPHEQLRQADRASNALLAEQDVRWQSLTCDLDASGISILTGEALAPRETAWLREHFESQLAPRLAPSITDAAEPFPFIRDGKIVLLVELGIPEDRRGRAPARGSSKALVPLPHGVPRFLALPGSSSRVIAIESVLSMFLDDLFADYSVLDHGLARVVREGNLKLATDVDDLLLLVRDAVERREHADVIRLEVESAMPEHLGAYLAEALGLITSEELERFHAEGEPVTASEFVAADRLLGLSDTLWLADRLKEDAPESARGRRLLFAAPEPARPGFVDEFAGDLFRAIAAKDRLLHFPYDDFGLVMEFLEQAAEDPDVVSIQQTLYRTGHDSPVVDTLAHAARLGRQVTAVVELEAREDERENIELADRLKRAGVTVLFGFRDLKVHVKALSVVRREGDTLRGYVNLATGNYHPGTARKYTDLSLLSADPDLVEDVALLFRYLTGSSPSGERAGREITAESFRRIAIAPSGLRARLHELISREIEHAKAGRPAAIWIKVNKLSDPRLIDDLYRASRHGVEIDVVVRGVCCLRPELAGLSEHIRVKSVIGRFLEHSRILCFGNGSGLPSGSADVFLSSADWMPHKLDRRVEALVPIDDADAKEHIQHAVMKAYLRDEAQSWRLDGDGAWTRDTTRGFSAQSTLMCSARSRKHGDEHLELR